MADTRNISADIYDMSGKFVKRLIDNKVYNPGFYTENLDVSGFANGTYVVRLISNEKVFQKHFMVLK